MQDSNQNILRITGKTVKEMYTCFAMNMVSLKGQSIPDQNMF